MNTRHAEELSYQKFCSPQKFHRAVSTLLGMIEGICIDQVVSEKECSYLHQWLTENADIYSHPPLDEVVPTVEASLKHGFIDEQALLDIKWLLEQLTSNEYKCIITYDLIALQGIICGVISDATINQRELATLQTWLQDHDYLKGHWPYDEVDNIITKVLHDHIIDSEEHDELLTFFSQFADYKLDADGESMKANYETISGICCNNPTITFNGKRFCITGHSANHTRHEIEHIITDLGGYITSSVSQKLNYLVVGAERNLCWKYNGYGRKIEAAMQLRKLGHPILIIHESDLVKAANELG